MPQPLTLLLIVVGLFVLLAVALATAMKLDLLKLKPTSSEPYRCCDRVLSPAEQKFHTALLAALPILCQRAGRSDPPLVFAKVRLGDVLATD